MFNPMLILFAITGFFLTFVTAYAWNIFFNMKYMQQLFHFPQIQRLRPLLKGVFFIPLLCVDIFLIHHYSLLPNTPLFLFTVKSPTVFWNVIGLIIACVGLIIISRFDKTELPDMNRLVISCIAYLCMLHICNLIIISATAVACMNAIPNGPLQNSINFLYFILFIHVVYVCIVISLKRLWLVVLFFAYIMVIAYANYNITADIPRLKSEWTPNS